MFDLVLILVVSIAVVRAALTLRKNRALFAEFHASQLVAPLICLFPIGLMAQLFLPILVGRFFATFVAITLFVPGMLALKRARCTFERTGTDRVRVVQDTLAIAFIAGVGGIAYLVVSAAMAVLLNVSSPLS